MAFSGNWMRLFCLCVLQVSERVVEPGKEAEAPVTTYVGAQRRRDVVLVEPRRGFLLHGGLSVRVAEQRLERRRAMRRRRLGFVVRVRRAAAEQVEVEHLDERNPRLLGLFPRLGPEAFLVLPPGLEGLHRVRG